MRLQGPILALSLALLAACAAAIADAEAVLHPGALTRATLLLGVAR